MKHFVRHIVFLLIVLGLAGCRSIDKSGLAQLRDQLDQSEPWRHSLPEIEKAPLRPNFPRAQSLKLPNGLTVMVIEDRRLPIVTMSLVTKAGSASDPQGKNGLMHLTGLMLKEGTKTKTSLEFAEEFAKLGTEVSVLVNKDMSTISASFLTDKIDSVADLFAGMVKSPRLDQEDFDRVRLQHSHFVASRQAIPSYVAQTTFLLAAYGDKHPYANPTIGKGDTVANISLIDIKNNHQRHFGPEQSALIVVGDVSLGQIQKLAKRHFKNWRVKATAPAAIKDPLVHKRMQTHLVGRAHAPQTYLLLGQPALAKNDYHQATFDVLHHILAGAPTSRLDAILREAKGWTYSVGAGTNALLGKGPFMVATSIQVPFGTDALNEILRQFESMQQTPVSEEELRIAKDGILRSFAGRYSTIGQVAANLAEQFVYKLPSDHDEKLYDAITKVTANDVMAIAQRVLKKDNLVAVAVGDLEAMKMPLAQFDLGTIIIKEEEQERSQPGKN